MAVLSDLTSVGEAAQGTQAKIFPPLSASSPCQYDAGVRSVVKKRWLVVTIFGLKIVCWQALRAPQYTLELFSSIISNLP